MIVNTVIIEEGSDCIRMLVQARVKNKTKITCDQKFTIAEAREFIKKLTGVCDTLERKNDMCSGAAR